jgi:hypothetical protein
MSWPKVGICEAAMETCIKTNNQTAFRKTYAMEIPILAWAVYYAVMSAGKCCEGLHLLGCDAGGG